MFRIFRKNKKKKYLSSNVTLEGVGGDTSLAFGDDEEQTPKVGLAKPYVPPSDKEIIEGLEFQDNYEAAFLIKDLKKQNAVLKGKLTKLENRYNKLRLDITGTQQAVMQSGLPVIIFNKPVRDKTTDEQLWDIKIFWKIPDEKQSEGFDTVQQCFYNCWDYIENQRKN